MIKVRIKTIDEMLRISGVYEDSMGCIIHNNNNGAYVPSIENLLPAEKMEHSQSMVHGTGIYQIG